MCIQTLEVNAEMKVTVFFPHQHDSIAPGTLAGSNGTRLQHLFQMVPHFLHHRWWDSSEMLLEWGIISYFYGMLGRVGTPQLCWV